MNDCDEALVPLVNNIFDRTFALSEGDSVTVTNGTKEEFRYVHKGPSKKLRVRLDIEG